MIKFFLKSVWVVLVIGVVGYGLFFVPLGERTLFQHIFRISQTDEAQDLGREARQASERAVGEIRDQLEESRSEDAGDERERDGTARDEREPDPDPAE